MVQRGGNEIGLALICFAAVHGSKLEIENYKLRRDEADFRVRCVQTGRRVMVVYGLKLDVRHWGDRFKIECVHQQHKSMKAKFPISNFDVP